MTTPYFVWVRGMRGPEPEKWPEMLRNMNGEPMPTLHKYEISDAEYWLSFHQLIAKYPPPEMETEKEKAA